MSWKLVEFFLLFGLTVTCVKRKSQDLVLLQLPKMQETIENATKAMSDDANLGNDDEVRQLQASANNFQLYFEESIYFLNKAADEVSDPNHKALFASFLKITQDNTYKLGKSINSNFARTKQVIKSILRNYLKVFSPSIAKKMFELTGQQLQVALNSADEVFNLGIFNVCLMYVELDYRKKTKSQIRLEIETTLEKVHKLLKRINLKDTQVSQELVTILRLLSHLSDRIVHKIERWAYVYNGKSTQVKVITGISQTLGSVVRKLRKCARADVTSFDLQQCLQEFFHSSFMEIRKLIALNTDGHKHESDICKDVSLEYLTVVSALSIKLEVIVVVTNN